MIHSRLQIVPASLLSVMIAAASMALPQEIAKAEKGSLPQAVIKSLGTKFRNPEIQKWTKEEEGGVILYDIEFRQDGNKFEADIREDGSIVNWEKKIAVADLPAAVRKSVEARYPKATIEEAMAATTVRGGKDVPEGFEVTLRTAKGKTIEMTVAADGKVLEDASAEQR